MGLIVGVPLLVFLVPLCLVIAYRNTRGWWLPGAVTFVVGLLMFVIIAATQTPSHGGGDIPIIDPSGLIGIFGFFLMICGAICFVVGALASGAGRRARQSPPPAALPPAYVMSRPRT